MKDILWGDPLLGALALYVTALILWVLSKVTLVGVEWFQAYRLRRRRRQFVQRLIKEYGPKWDELHHAVVERMFGDLDVTGLSDICQQFQDEVKRINKV